jgi:hypothetical protein
MVKQPHQSILTLMASLPLCSLTNLLVTLMTSFSDAIRIRMPLIKQKAGDQRTKFSICSTPNHLILEQITKMWSKDNALNHLILEQITKMWSKDPRTTQPGCGKRAQCTVGLLEKPIAHRPPQSIEKETQRGKSPGRRAWLRGVSFPPATMAIADTCHAHLSYDPGSWRRCWWVTPYWWPNLTILCYIGYIWPSRIFSSDSRNLAQVQVEYIQPREDISDVSDISSFRSGSKALALALGRIYPRRQTYPTISRVPKMWQPGPVGYILTRSNISNSIKISRVGFEIWGLKLKDLKI